VISLEFTDKTSLTFFQASLGKREEFLSFAKDHPSPGLQNTTDKSKRAQNSASS
jgi:hypothetical protein